MQSRKDSLYLSSMCVSVYMYLNAIYFIAVKMRKLNAIVHDHAIRQSGVYSGLTSVTDNKTDNNEDNLKDTAGRLFLFSTNDNTKRK